MSKKTKTVGAMLLLAALSSPASFAAPSEGSATATVAQQNGSCKGVVLDEAGEAIIGASVMVKGTKSGTATGIDGDFAIANVPVGSTVVVSFVGYNSAEVKWTGSPLTITLKENSTALDEVVVVGYGTQKKANLTGAVSQVKMDDVLGDRPVVNALSALQGAMPGLQITSSSAEPGQFKSLNIRGITSLNSGGSPLVLIDNVPGDIGMINPSDIESVSVLKDAASTAIYGARAAFGVVLVTTKQGKKNERFTVSYNNNFGFQKSVNRPEIADGLEWMQAYLDAEFNAGSYYTGQDMKTWMKLLQQYRENPSSLQTHGDGIYTNPDDGVDYYLHEKDIYANILGDFGFQQTHNVSASGGTNTLTYRMSLGYTKEKGVLDTDKSNFSRLNGSSFISAEITPWLKQSLDVRYAQRNRLQPVLSTATSFWDMRKPSVYPEGYLTLPNGDELLSDTPKNLLSLATDNQTTTDDARIFTKTELTPLKGWNITFEYTFNKTWTEQRSNTNTYEYTDIQLGRKTTNTVTSLTTNNGNTNYNAINLYSTYKHSFNDVHNFTVMAGFNQEKSNYRNIYGYTYDMVNGDYPSHNTATAETKTLTESHTEYAVRGGFYRLNYDYKGRYLFETNGRYDGSSKFPKSNRFGFFPSVSVGWNVAQEEFMNGANSWLNQLKLRGTWGQVGNQNISAYAYIPTISSGKASWLVNDTKPLTLGTPGLVSDNFTWEVVETLDGGVDFGMLSNRLTGSFDYYRRDTKDMLAPGVELPAVVGATAAAQNIADLRTQGWELSLNWRDQIGEVGYSIGFNLYDNWSKITKYKNEANLIDSYFVGETLNDIWGYETDGYYTIDDFEDTNTWKLKEGVTSIQGVSVRPGDVKFKNLMDDENSTNEINDGMRTLENHGDLKVIGNSTLRLQYGVNLGVNYRGFDLSVLFQGVGKRDVWISDARRWPFQSGQFGQIFKDQLDYWKPVDAENGDWTAQSENPEYFRLYGQMNNFGSNARVQTKYLLNGAYCRVKNVTLGYSFPKQLISRAQLTNLKAFVSCENLYTFHHLPNGYDPERLSWGYPFFRTVSFGINVTL